MQGSKLLKITGILMIIGGSLLIVIFLLGLVGGTLYAATDTATGGFYMIISLIGLLLAAIELVAGIMGVKNCNKPEKAKSCFTMGIVLIVVSLVNNITSIYISGFSGNTASALVIGLIVPVLYTYGASQLKKSA